MVFQKRAAKGAKTNQKTPLKSAKMQEAAEMLVDSDDTNGSDDVPTTAIKTPKGKAGERKVSFQVQGTPAKNTPAKNSPVKGTPAKGTPGKGGLQQFSGMKNKQKKGVEDDDEDDDDEDDSDFDVDDLGEDLDLAFDEDDDDDDDSEDDDDEDDEEEEKAPKSAKNKKQEKQKSPKAAAQSPKKTPKSAKKEKGVSKELSSALEAEKKGVDAVKLYVGNLPHDVTVEELKSLSADITMVYLPTLRSKKVKSRFAFLQFDSEAKTEENLKKLKAAKLRGQPFTVDFVGAKSSNDKKSKTPNFNPKKLFITGLPLDCTIHQVSKFFPKAFQFIANSSNAYRTVFVNFWTDEDCTEAIESHPTIEVGGLKCSVLHAVGAASVNKKAKKRNRKQKSKQNGTNPAKKIKLATPKKVESVDDDDDDDEE